MRTHVMVGTRKGAWIVTSNEGRERWSVSEPMMPGWTVHHVTADLRRDPPRLYAAANHWAWGPSVARSDDGGKTWEQRSPGLGFPQDMGLAVANVWHVEPAHESQPGLVYAGTQPAALYQQTNPRQLRREIYQALERLWAGPGVAEPAREAIAVGSRRTHHPEGDLKTRKEGLAR